MAEVTDASSPRGQRSGVPGGLFGGWCTVFVVHNAGQGASCDVSEGAVGAEVDARGGVVAAITEAWSLPATYRPLMGWPFVPRTRARGSAARPANVPKDPGAISLKVRVNSAHS